MILARDIYIDVKNCVMLYVLRKMFFHTRTFQGFFHKQAATRRTNIVDLSRSDVVRIIKFAVYIDRGTTCATYVLDRQI